MASFIDVVYENQDRQVFWCGMKMTDGDGFNAFMTEKVASRLYDEEEQAEFETHLRGLSNTNFARENLDVFLAADTEESKDGWVVGEAIAEAFLTQEHNVVWPWNMNRDKRNPRASLAGADLVGFKVDGPKVQFAFGEVKTSQDSNSPPGLMKGPKGMPDQLTNLAEDSSLIWGLIRWLFSRCRTQPHKEFFRSAMKLFVDSGCKITSLYGVLVRDTSPIEKDLRRGGQKLAEVVNPPAICHLFAIYIPCTVTDLPYRVTGDRR